MAIELSFAFLLKFVGILVEVNRNGKLETKKDVKPISTLTRSNLSKLNYSIECFITKQIKTEFEYLHDSM